MIRWLKRIARLTFVLVLVGVAVSTIIIWRSLPREQGVVTLKARTDQLSLSANASLRRDAVGVPHIKAKSREDVYLHIDLSGYSRSLASTRSPALVGARSVVMVGLAVTIHVFIDAVQCSRRECSPQGRA